ncbi:hypothetical protein [Priestia endophytica]|uniref:aldose epimerase family protein n=1 Tax=Priestia endophytica TaxID=135735 RepID=UPI002E2459CA|nr:hypothetical protein [Priestia endophytica]
MDGNSYSIDQNERTNHLHGGKLDFSQRIWNVETQLVEDSVSLIFRYTSPHEENRYPRTLHATTTYTLTNDDEWIIS